jgi:hypothetical protein
VGHATGGSATRSGRDEPAVECGEEVADLVGGSSEGRDQPVGDPPQGGVVTLVFVSPALMLEVFELFVRFCFDGVDLVPVGSVEVDAQLVRHRFAQ